MTYDRAVAERPVDLTNCDREPIHVPGAIQPHGLLLALDAGELRILQASANAEGFTGRPAHALVGTLLADVLDDDAFALLARRLAGPADERNPIPVTFRHRDARYDVIAQVDGPTVVLEFEAAELTSALEIETFFGRVRSAVERIETAATVPAVCDALAREFAAIGGFDRTMVYRFDPDWNGAVVAEVRDDALPPFLGLHYPASDVPRQARELYRRNSLRLIPDARYTPAPLEPPLNPLTQAPLDLSLAVLRSVSPMHLQYLANMHVAATLTASLLTHGELWGLVASHHRTPRFVGYRVRVAVELLARTASLRIAALEDQEDFRYRMQLRSLQPALLEAIAKDGTFTAAVADEALLQITGAEGVAIKTEGEPTLIGRTPRLRSVRALLKWLDERGDDVLDPYVTNALPLENPAFEEAKDEGCGVLAVPLTSTAGGWIVWFRPEVIREVTWGGDPAKPVEAHGNALTPRTSFEAWKQTVRLHARPWLPAQVDAAIELRRLLSDVMMRRAREFEKLNAELARSNAELESFAHVASHDLKEPLRGVHHYARFLREDYSPSLDERGRELVDGIEQLALRMEAQIESLLRLARVGEEGAARRRISLDEPLDEALALLRARIADAGAEIVRPGPLPAGLFNSARAREVFVNLIGNALKYNDADVPRIEIGAASAESLRRRARSATAAPESGPAVAVYVRDNGIGIPEKHLETIFRMFKRLHARDRFGGGSGAGLAIARKIVERNGGELWAQSAPGEGTTFTFTFPLAEETP